MAQVNWWGEYPPDDNDFYTYGSSTINYKYSLTSDPTQGSSIDIAPEEILYNTAFASEPGNESINLEDDNIYGPFNYYDADWSLAIKIAFARETLSVLERPAISIKPGPYRVFLTPSAMQELINMLNWGGFGLKSHRTAQTPLLKMSRDGVTLNPKVTMLENHHEGLTPRFTSTGFIKPDAVTLIENGVYQATLNAARSAKEYGEEVNSHSEQPQSLHINAGNLPQSDVLKTLDTGIYVSNLWYCNYSDRSHCRITGMTRFASLWVENGQPVAPISVMRFDETLYHMLGDNLIDLTQEREHILDASTYVARSEASALLPGALVDQFRLTL